MSVRLAGRTSSLWMARLVRGQGSSPLRMAARMQQPVVLRGASHQMLLAQQRRFFSDSPSGGKGLPPSSESVPGNGGLGSEPPALLADASGGGDLATAATVMASEHSNVVISAVMSIIDQTHQLLDLPYWQSIIAVTLALRTLLIPVAIFTTRATARLTLLRPEMEKLSARLRADPARNNVDVQQQYQREMKLLMEHHKVNPVRAMMWPFAQLPPFLAFFFALKEMGTYYPGIATGGDFWFVDLSMQDATYTLPILNSLTFLLMTELSSKDMKGPQAAMMKNIMRGMAVLIVPLTAAMPQGVFMYWVTSNIWSLAQSKILNNDSVRKALSIPTLSQVSAAYPNEANTINPLAAVQKVLDSEKPRAENAKAEVLAPKATAAKTTASPPPVTYSSPPKKK